MTENWDNWNFLDNKPDSDAVLTEAGWEIPLKGTDPSKGLTELIVTKNDPIHEFHMHNQIPKLWLDASETDSILNVNGDVYQWIDKSTDNRSVIQTQEAYQPQTGVAEINGLNALRFDGSRLETNFNASGYTNFTGYIVLRPLNNSGNRMMLDQSNGGVGFYFEARGNDFHFFTYTPNNRLRNDNVYNPETLIVEFIKTATYKEVTVNGVTTRIDIATGPITNSADMSIGARVDQLNRFLQADVGEISLYDKELTLEDRLGIRSYLERKWIG